MNKKDVHIFELDHTHILPGEVIVMKSEHMKLLDKSPTVTRKIIIYDSPFRTYLNDKIEEMRRNI